MIKKLSVIGFTVLFIAIAGAVYADEITNSIKEALDSYKNGDFTEAVSSLNYASQLIQQKKSETLKKLLPGPLNGWTAEDSTSQAVSTAMLGGGVTAERRYKKGQSRVTVRIVTDSPMLQSVLMMLSNPMFATADGGKLKKINRQKAIVKYDPAQKEGEIKIIVANRFLVSVEGEDVAQKDLEGYAGAVNYQKMKSMP